MGFKEFLEENVKLVEPSYQARKGTTVQKYISVYALSEFYWKNGGLFFIKHFPKKMRKVELLLRNADAYECPEKTNDWRFLTQQISFDLRLGAIRFKQAVSCLGESEVEARLKKLGEKK